MKLYNKYIKQRDTGGDITPKQEIQIRELIKGGFTPEQAKQAVLSGNYSRDTTFDDENLAFITRLKWKTGEPGQVKEIPVETPKSGDGRFVQKCDFGRLAKLARDPDARAEAVSNGEVEEVTIKGKLMVRDKDMPQCYVQIEKVREPGNLKEQVAEVSLMVDPEEDLGDDPGDEPPGGGSGNKPTDGPRAGTTSIAVLFRFNEKGKDLVIPRTYSVSIPYGADEPNELKFDKIPGREVALSYEDAQGRFGGQRSNTIEVRVPVECAYDGTPTACQAQVFEQIKQKAFDAYVNNGAVGRLGGSRGSKPAAIIKANQEYVERMSGMKHGGRINKKLISYIYG